MIDIDRELFNTKKEQSIYLCSGYFLSFFFFNSFFLDQFSDVLPSEWWFWNFSGKFHVSILAPRLGLSQTVWRGAKMPWSEHLLLSSQLPQGWRGRSLAHLWERAQGMLWVTHWWQDSLLSSKFLGHAPQLLFCPVGIDGFTQHHPQLLLPSSGRLEPIKPRVDMAHSPKVMPLILASSV